MKITIEIADALLARAKREAERQGRTLSDLVEDSLRDRLAAGGLQQAFQLKKHAFHGEGTHPSVTEGNWESVRDLIYRLG